MTSWRKNFSTEDLDKIDEMKSAQKAVPEKIIYHWRLAEWFPDLTSEVLADLKSYYDELVKFNKAVNLVSPKTLSYTDALHFADAICASKIVLEKINKNKELYDIGSGNGFPGLVFAILNRDQKIVLFDIDQRKCEFLKQVVSKLKLNSVQVMNRKVEDLPADSVEQAISRGFAPLPKALLMLKKAIRKDGVFFHLKSDDWSQELAQLPTQLFSVWKTEQAGEYTLPVLGNKVFIIRTDKIS